MLNKLSIQKIQGLVCLSASIDRQNILSNHLIAIDLIKKTNGTEATLASLDPWQSKIEYRFKTGDTKMEFRLIGRTEQEQIPLSDWINNAHD